MISNDAIFTIVQSILSTMLELDAIPCELSPAIKRSDAVIGCVQISGEWQGAIVIQGSEGLARSFAARLFDESSDSLSDDDVRDAFAEATNMIGGNIKGLVPSPSFLSIPSVTSGQDFDFRLSNANAIRDLTVDCNGDTLRIMMFEEDRSQPTRFEHRKQNAV